MDTPVAQNLSGKDVSLPFLCQKTHSMWSIWYTTPTLLKIHIHTPFLSLVLGHSHYFTGVLCFSSFHFLPTLSPPTYSPMQIGMTRRLMSKQNTHSTGFNDLFKAIYQDLNKQVKILYKNAY